MQKLVRHKCSLKILTRPLDVYIHPKGLSCADWPQCLCSQRLSKTQLHASTSEFKCILKTQIFDRFWKYIRQNADKLKQTFVSQSCNNRFFPIELFAETMSSFESIRSFIKFNLNAEDKRSPQWRLSQSTTTNNALCMRLGIKRGIQRWWWWW